MLHVNGTDEKGNDMYNYIKQYKGRRDFICFFPQNYERSSGK